MSTEIEPVPDESLGDEVLDYVAETTAVVAVAVHPDDHCLGVAGRVPRLKVELGRAAPCYLAFRMQHDFVPPENSLF